MLYLLRPITACTPCVCRMDELSLHLQRCSSAQADAQLGALSLTGGHACPIFPALSVARQHSPANMHTCACRLHAHPHTTHICPCLLVATPAPFRAATITQRPGVRSMRSTLTSLPLIVAPAEGVRRTKIICTMGPSCWTEEKLSLVRWAVAWASRFDFVVLMMAQLSFAVGGCVIR